MKKPDITRRLLPLLDVIFILLAFFIILPHGIKSNETLENQALRKHTKDMERELSQYQWKYGPVTPKKSAYYRSLLVLMSGNQIRIDMDGKPIPDNEWQNRLQKAIEDNNSNFVIVHVQDVPGNKTRTGKIREVESFLQERKLLFVVTVGKI